MIKFHCPNCGQKIATPADRAGTMGRCPRCKLKITTPNPLEPESNVHSTSNTPTPVNPPLLQLLEIPTTSVSKSTHLSPPHQNEDDQPNSLSFEPAPRYTGERQKVWLLDILCYPISMGGLITMAIVVGINLFLSNIAMALGGFVLVGRVILAIYFAWYLIECIQDSAMGGTRAPDIPTPGLGDMWSRVFYVLSVYSLFLVPVVVYHMIRPQVDMIFGGLAIWSIVFFPIGLIAMAVMDSADALNPFFLLGAILRTFFSYVGMLILLLGLSILLGLLSITLERYSPWFLGSLLTSILDGFSLMILAHILGRFYWRNREKINWGF